MRSTLLFLTVLLCACNSGGSDTSDGGDDPSIYVAMQADFDNYEKWGGIYLGEATPAAASGHPLGPEWGYRNRMPVDHKYPVGTILVKEIRNAYRFEHWDVFGMAKRGGGYNQNGATDWEFFTLQLDDTGTPIIATRGANPADADSSGHGYGAGADGMTCNLCHAADGTAATDHTLSVGLRP